MCDIARGDFIPQQRNAVLVGGTGTGKTHLAIAIARSCIRGGVRFYNVVDLVNRLETETRASRQGRLADYLTRMDFIIPDELGTLRRSKNCARRACHAKRHAIHRGLSFEEKKSRSFKQLRPAI